MVDGINSTGIAIPDTTPKSVSASDSLSPVRMSIAGNKTAIAELTSDEPARTEVIGALAKKSGLSRFCGLASLPPNRKKQMADAEKENR